MSASHLGRDGASDSSSTLVGVLVTHRRPDALAGHLDTLARQTRRLDRLVVVDNAPSAEGEALAAGAVDRAAPSVEYLPMAENIGPAGGIACGMRAVLAGAHEDGWVALLDDDDPPRRDDLLEHLLGFATAVSAEPEAAAMVGTTGARFDGRTGRMQRLADEELSGAVEVDYVAGNQLPLVRMDAIRQVGAFREDLFFGFEELEFALRFRDAGYRIVVDGDLAWWARSRAGRLGPGHGGPSVTESRAPWRRYYSVRNLITILRARGRWLAAFRVSITAGLAKPVMLTVRDPASGWLHLRYGVRGVVDGWLGRMGRRVLPPVASDQARRRP